MLAYVFLLALLAPVFVSSQGTQGIRRCGSRPFIEEIRIEGCSHTPCNLFQGSDAVMEIDFRSSRVANGLRPQVFARAMGQTIEYNLPPNHQNACNHLIVGSCPLSANEDVTYRFVFGITSAYPPIPVTVELTLWDHTNQYVFCAEIDIHVRIR